MRSKRSRTASSVAPAGGPELQDHRHAEDRQRRFGHAAVRRRQARGQDRRQRIQAERHEESAEQKRSFGIM